jgi:hypothetical protein
VHIETDSEVECSGPVVLSSEAVTYKITINKNTTEEAVHAQNGFNSKMAIKVIEASIVL